MPLFALPFPAIDPVLVSVGPFAIRWYALAYIGGLLLGWLYARRLSRDESLWGGRPRPDDEALDDLLVYAALGVVLGGRIGYVLFYNLPHYLAHPLEALMVWQGGMSFHGGLTGCFLALVWIARSRGLPILSLADLAAVVAPVGLLLGRIANFINGELWGRASDVPWAVEFPTGGFIPRHPSQLYEAATEGLLLGLMLLVLVMRGGLRRPGFASGAFATGYGIARIFCEFFREPDPQIGFLFGGATMGMLLSVPLVLLGAWLMMRSRPVGAAA